MTPTPLTPDALERFLAAFADLCDAHQIVLESREPLVASPASERPEVRDRRRYTSGDLDDGDFTEYDPALYVTISAGTACADRIRRDTGITPHHYATY
jgi:hypothetical protein